jgi:hypothetical protein
VEFQDVLEAHLLGIELDESMMYASLRFRSEDGVLGRIDMISLYGVPIRMQVCRLSLRSGLTTLEGISSLGDINAFSLENNRLMLDGDFGCFEFIAGRFDIGAVK